jgi:rhodanese-related sulfurtransferase
MSPLFSRPPTIPTVSVHDAARSNDDVALVDVRELHEWRAGHAPHTKHLPLSGLDANRLPTARVLHIVCRSGNRSARAVETLRAAGYDAHNVEGGMLAWARHGFPIIRSDGRPGAVA